MSGYLGSVYRDEVTPLLLTYLEDYPEKFIFVAADYPQNFSKVVGANSGMRSRYRYVIDLKRWDAALSTKVLIIMLNKLKSA